MLPVRPLRVALLAASLTAACGARTSPHGAGAPGDGVAPGLPGQAPAARLTGARRAGGDILTGRVGDLFMTTWGADDRVYMTFGDGTGRPGCIPSYDLRRPVNDWPVRTGPGGCFTVEDLDSVPCGECLLRDAFCAFNPCGKACQPLCAFTDHGLLVFRGLPPRFDACGSGGCIATMYVPSGRWGNGREDDKPSSIVEVQGRLLVAGHRPLQWPRLGYLAYSDDGGRSFREVAGTPWIDTRGSDFRVVMFVNMGRGHALARDGFLYALAVVKEMSWGKPMPVRLARVPARREAIVDYRRYRYYAGTLPGGGPRWSPDPRLARPVPGLTLEEQASAAYHPGTGLYLVLTTTARDATFAHRRDTMRGVLYTAEAPWGPWRRLPSFDWGPHGYMPGIITKGMDRDGLYFTSMGRYDLAIGRLRLVRAGR